MLLLRLSLPEWASQPAWSLIAVSLGVGGLALLGLMRREALLTLLAGLVGRVAPGLQAGLMQRVARALASLAVLRNHRDTLQLLGWSAAVWGTAILVNVLVLDALQIRVAPISAVFVLLVVQLGISLPSAPATIGLFEYLCMVSLLFFGVEATEALSFGILLHVIVFVPSTLVGLLLFWTSGVTLGEAQKNDER